MHTEGSNDLRHGTVDALDVRAGTEVEANVDETDKRRVSQSTLYQASATTAILDKATYLAEEMMKK